MNLWKFNAVKKFLGNLYPESSEIPEVSSGSQHSCIKEDTLIEIKITTAEGKVIETNLKVKASDIELFKNLTM